MSLSASVRSTTSSRYPGVVFTGVIYTQRRGVFPCAKCGGLTLADAPHAPRWVQRSERFLQVDCVGDEVRR